MKYKFKCTLLSDVILNKKSASEGENETLDFIPGNNFLGIVASSIYSKLSSEDAYTVFHSGKVRFGDAHPSTGKVRSLRIPASYYHPKGKSLSDGCYLNYSVDHSDFMKKGIQLKQCRSGFYSFGEDHVAEEVQFETNFSLKSAYDSAMRKSDDGLMFGYEALPSGLDFLFEIDIDDDVRADLVDKIKETISGEKHIGRSKTAQYGLVKIDEFNYDENSSTSKIQSVANCSGPICTVYADGRLIFLDEFGLPTLRPSAKDLGFNENAQIIWNQSQVRYFQYAPWNGQRKNFDTDRCGFEKGSVFVVNVSKVDKGVIPSESEYVGYYTNEGFGKVIFNPDFLDGAEKEGKAPYSVAKSAEDRSSSNDSKTEKSANSPFIIYLKSRKSELEGRVPIMAMVNKNVSAWSRSGIFKDITPSQWGTIRQFANQYHNLEQLEKQLFYEDKDPDSDKNGYLVHGVSKDVWAKRGRLETLKKFIKDCEKDTNIGKERVYYALVNLASEMAKKSKNK